MNGKDGKDRISPGWKLVLVTIQFHTRTEAAIDVTTDTCGRNCRTTPENNIDCLQVPECS